MKSKRAVVIILRKGDDFRSALARELEKNSITSAFIYGVGGFLTAELAVFDSDKKEYQKKIFEDNQLEVLNLTGDVSKGPTGETVIHCHTVLAGRDYNAIGGHLVAATVGATCEITVAPLDYQLNRRPDPESGINTIQN
jgi:uncharacterized protein